MPIVYTNTQICLREELHLMLADCHMHTPLCGHAVGEPAEYVRAASDRGLSLITFTCHTPITDEGFGQAGIRMRADQLPLYREMVRTATELGSELGVTVLYGIEAEVFPDEQELTLMDRVLAEERFDFVLGSLHHASEIYRGYLEREGLFDDREIIRRYFEDLAAGAETGRYHSLAHPDLIRIYGTVEPFDPAEYETVIKACLERIRDAGVCIEVNTSGYTKGVFEIHPAPQIMEWASELGLDFTLGSDSHMPESVAQYFGRAAQLLRARGVEQFTYFQGGTAVRARLPEF